MAVQHHTVQLPRYVDIMYSVIAQESIECLEDFIENIKRYNENISYIICIHLNERLQRVFSTDDKHTLINTTYYNKKPFSYDILKAHIDNYTYVKKNKIRYTLFMPLTSNCLFIREMPSISYFYDKLSIICMEPHTERIVIGAIEASGSAHWYFFLKNTAIIDMCAKKKIPVRSRQFTGVIYKHDVIDTIFQFILENKVEHYITQQTAFEEILMPSLELYFTKRITDRYCKIVDAPLTNASLKAIYDVEPCIYVLQRTNWTISDPIRACIREGRHYS